MTNFQFSNFNFQTERRGGFGLVEIVVAVGIISVTLFALLQTELVAIKLLRTEKENLEATLLAEESLEAMRSMRDESWTAQIATLTDGAVYHPIVENGKWKLSSGTSTAINGKYQRSVRITTASRNGLDQIAASGTADQNTKKVTAIVSWGSGKQKILTAYIANFLSSITPLTEAKTFFFENGTTDANLASFPSQNAGDGDPSQSFTTGNSTSSITKVELYIKKVGTNLSDIYLEIREGPTGNIIGTSTIITGSTVSTTTLSWVSFRFPDFVALSPNQSYTLRLGSIPPSTDAWSGSSGPLHWGYQQTAGSPYSGGAARRYIGRLSNPSDQGQLLDQFDYSFRVYTLQ